MTQQTLTLYCHRCSVESSHTQKTPNHVAHLLLSLLTAGIWVVVWVLVAMSSARPVCSRCGEKRGAAR